jgi:hypothetical protein
MGSVTYANDINEVKVQYRYKNPVDAEVFNEQSVNVLKSGLYKKADPLIAKLSNTAVQVGLYTAMMLNTGVSVIESTTLNTVVKDILTKLDIKTSKNLTGISATAPYIVIEFLYSQSQTITPTLKNVAYTAIDTNKQIILGKCVYRDSVQGSGLKDEMYDIMEARVIDSSPLYEAEKFVESFQAEVTGALQVTVRGGNLEGETVDDLVVNYGAGGGATPLPAAGKHRYDFVYVDDTDTLILVQGEEESDVGEDEYPRPDKTNLALYRFPVTYIYVSSDLNGTTSVIEPSDIENVYPRFLRKTQLLSGSLSDIIITSQEEFESYFGNSVLTNQGGNTPGQYDDGFTCEYNSSVKSVYVPGKRVVLKNQFDANGNQVPYELHTRVILQDNSEVYQAQGAQVKFTKSYSGFMVKDQTNMEVDEYSSNQIEVLSEDGYYTDQYANNYGNQVSIQSGDKIFGFSDTPNINKEYNVTNIEKGIKEDATIASSPGVDWSNDNIDIRDAALANISTNDFDTLEYQLTATGVAEAFKRLIVAFINSSGYVELTGYKFNNSTKNYDSSFTSFNLPNSGTWDNVRIGKSGSRIIVVANNQTNLQVFTAALNDADDGFSFADFDNTRAGEQINGTASIKDSSYSIFLENDSTLHIVGIDGSNDLDYFRGVAEVAPGVDGFFQNFSNTTHNVVDASNTTHIGLIVDEVEDKRYITFNENNTKMSCMYYNGSSWSQVDLDTGATCGFDSRMDFADDSQGQTGVSTVIYIAYTYSAAKTNIKFAQLSIDGVGSNLDNIETVVTGEAIQFDYIDMKVNNENLYPEFGGDVVELIQIIGFNQQGLGANGLYVAQSLNSYTKNWNVNSVDLQEVDNQGQIASLFNDYVYIAYYNGSTTGSAHNDKSFLLKLFYNFEITVTETVGTLNLTDLVVSPDYVTNIDLDLRIDGNSKGGVNVVGVANAVDSNFTLKIINSDYTNGINGSGASNTGKTNDVVVMLDIDETCSHTNNVNKVNHSNFKGSNIVVGVQVGDKNFSDCTNLYVQGVINKELELGSGYYDA